VALGRLLIFSVNSWYECCSEELLTIEASACVLIMSAIYTSSIYGRHITYCSVLQEHIHRFAALEFLLCLCRWNWLFVSILLVLRCFILKRMTSTGSAPLAGVAPLATLLCELLTVPSIILYLGKRFHVLQGHLQEDQYTKDQRPLWIPWWSGKIFFVLKCLLKTVPHSECDCCCGHPNWNKVMSYTSNIILSWYSY